MKKFLKFLIFNFVGRYILFGAIALTGIFSDAGTIDFLTTDWYLFHITASIGIAGLILNFIIHIIAGIYWNIRYKKEKK
jgi:thiamine transporter ThiT